MKREGQRDRKRRRERKRERGRETLNHSFIANTCTFIQPTCTYLAHLKCGSHLAVDLVLLLGDLDVTFLRRGHDVGQVWIPILTIWKEVAT